MANKQHRKELDFLHEFDLFIRDSSKGRRLQPNAKRISAGTITNYRYCQKILTHYCVSKKIQLRLVPTRWLNARTILSEKNYWRKFYRRFTDYLYHECGYYDNYVGQQVKIIKIFFNYLNKERSFGVGEFHKQFYVRKEEIAIFPLMPEELNFLVTNKEFENSLDKRMLKAKDFFVFGCTVALRFSDLVALKHSNIRVINGQYYLVVRSIKTGTDSMIRLPDYAVHIINRYRYRQKQLLPGFSLSSFNKYIKKILERAGFTYPVRISRNRRGVPVMLKIKDDYRFCDVASSHTMRRTAITTMLSLGMPEQIVRKISGHSPNSKEFYRYMFGRNQSRMRKRIGCFIN